MDLKGLKAFCDVAEHGSFSRAAAALGIAQSVLSRQVSALESELGGRLLHRTGRGATPTELGGALRPRAQAVLSLSQEIAVEAAGLRGNPAGTVDLGVVPGLARHLVGRLGPRLLRDYPRIRLRVHEGYSGQAEDWLASGRVEVALFNRYRGARIRGAEILLRADMMLVGPRGHAALKRREVAFRDLHEIPLVGPVRPNTLTAMMSELAARQRIALNYVAEGSNSVIIRELVARCGLCTIFPRHFVEREMAGGAFAAARIVRPALEQTTWLAVGTQRPASFAARVVARLVREAM